MDNGNSLGLITFVIVFAALGAALLKLSSAQTDSALINTSALSGDINNDNVVDIFDLSILLNQWGQTTSPTDPVPVGQSGQTWNLVFQDEFEGTSLDESAWGYQNGTWNASEVQNCFVAANSVVSGGTLQIISKYEPGYQCFSQTRDFTSGFVQTKNKVAWTYGYFEARIKMPDSDSTWPAFWLSPNDAVYGGWPQSGEIDVFEARGYDITQVHGNAHWGNSGSDKQQQAGHYIVGDFTQWHTYAIEWSEGEIRYYVDGNHYHTINNFDEPNATTHPGPFDQDFYIRLNSAVGGTYLQPPHNDANNSIDELPATMEVDYVRVWQ